MQHQPPISMPLKEPVQKPQSLYQPGRDPLDFDDFVNAVGTGSSRSRSIIGWLMTAAFIAMLALLNSRRPEHNWFASRLSTHQNATHWVRFPDDESLPNDSIRLPGSTRVVANVFSRDSFLAFFAPVFHLDSFDLLKINQPPPQIRLTVPRFLLLPDGSIDASQVKPSQLYATLISVSGMRIATRSELVFLVRAYDRARIDNALLIKIPLLGISFDVNWLSVISGAAFSILFFLLYHSLARERKNLTLLFRMADDRKIESVSLYQLLSMQQVLTVPHSIDEYLKMYNKKAIKALPWHNNLKDHGLRVFSFVPIFVPLTVCMVICHYDYSTMDLGSAVNGQLASITFQISLVFLVTTFVLFGTCAYEWVQMHMLWKKEAETIRDLLYAAIDEHHLASDEEDTTTKKP